MSLGGIRLWPKNLDFYHAYLRPGWSSRILAFQIQKAKLKKKIHIAFFSEMIFSLRKLRQAPPASHIGVPGFGFWLWFFPPASFYADPEKQWWWLELLGFFHHQRKLVLCSQFPALASYSSFGDLGHFAAWTLWAATLLHHPCHCPSQNII